VTTANAHDADHALPLPPIGVALDGKPLADLPPAPADVRANRRTPVPRWQRRGRRHPTAWYPGGESYASP